MFLIPFSTSCLYLPTSGLKEWFCNYITTPTEPSKDKVFKKPSGRTSDYL